LIGEQVTVHRTVRCVARRATLDGDGLVLEKPGTTVFGVATQASLLFQTAQQTAVRPSVGVVTVLTSDTALVDGMMLVERKLSPYGCVAFVAELGRRGPQQRTGDGLVRVVARRASDSPEGVRALRESRVCLVAAVALETGRVELLGRSVAIQRADMSGIAFFDVSRTGSMTVLARSLRILFPVYRRLEGRRQFVVTDLAGVTADSVLVAFRGNGYEEQSRNDEQR
jgi:hypothetical protein